MASGRPGSSSGSRPGSTLPRPKLSEYIFTDKLGSGTYATVYKAYRKSGKREVVAIKCVQKSSLNKVSTENLLTEIKLLKNLKHDHIVELKDFQWDDKYIYLIMEYCSGGDLSKFIQAKRTLSEYVAKRFLQQLALALQYMRSQNVSHMDLKPQNILLSNPENPVLKIGDFGFAQYLIGETDAAFLRGSPLYMAPEIVIKRHYNEKADLWSVGVILFECLFGTAPFRSKTLAELKEKIVDTKPIEIPYGVKISEKCRSLLLGLLKRNPADRMSYEDFLNHPFIDLEHMPSSESFKIACKLVQEAVEKDTNGDYQKAVKLYCKALEHFVPAIHYEKDPTKKQHLREKVKEYMQRAEALKQIIKPTAKKRQPQDNITLERSISQQAANELGQLAADHELLQAALKVIASAENKEQLEDYEGASKQYEIALESCIKILQEEPKGRRRELLQSQVDKWMSRAEEIQGYLNVSELNTTDTSKIEEEEENRNFLSYAQSCVLQ